VRFIWFVQRNPGSQEGNTNTFVLRAIFALWLGARGAGKGLAWSHFYILLLKTPINFTKTGLGRTPKHFDGES
jgi:hypothetical protein